MGEELVHSKEKRTFHRTLGTQALTEGGVGGGHVS